MVLGVDTLGQFAELFNVSSEQGWCSSLFEIGHNLGFDQTLFALVCQPGQRLEDAFLRSSYSSQWRHIYDTTQLHHVDPTVAHCVTRNTPLIWSPDIFTSKPQKEMYEEACSYGIRSGVTLPIHGPKGELGIMCFVNDAKPGKKFRQELLQHLPLLSLMRDFVFDSSLPFAAKAGEFEPVPSLTPREVECLRWAAAGKSSWEIAKILICSEAAINFHIGNVRRKMDVTTRREAVVKALRLGLIHL
jgi:LuxR family transcriptional regulator, quorum-sensing system regulator LasR